MRLLYTIDPMHTCIVDGLFCR